MIPIRLTLLLIFFIILMLLVLGNPVSVQLNFLFYTERFELYKIIIGSMLLGVLGTLIYTSQVRNLRRSRDRQMDYDDRRH
ncbi:MAG: hypothetical protein NXI24_18955 [bacterium]|nr:hypothetical protein [bacterium]